MDNKVFESSKGDLILFDEVASSAVQLSSKRAVYLKCGDYILLYGADSDEFAKAYKVYLNCKYRQS